MHFLKMFLYSDHSYVQAYSWHSVSLSKNTVVLEWDGDVGLITLLHHSYWALLWSLNNTTTPKCILILLLNQFKVAYTSLRPIHLHSNPFMMLKRDTFYIGRQYNDN